MLQKLKPLPGKGFRDFKAYFTTGLLDIKGTIITIDAMGTQTAIAKQIIEAGGDYILALKGNQGSLHKAVKTFFKQALESQWEGIDYSYDDGNSAEHYRIESRQVWAVPISQVPHLAKRQKWKGFKTIVMVRRKRTLWNGETEQVSILFG